MISLILLLSLKLLLVSSLLLSKPKVLVLGGSGRVGGSAVNSLLKEGITDVIDVGGRTLSTFEELKIRHEIITNKNSNFIKIDCFDINKLTPIIQNYDIIINTAGPFQGLNTSPVLESALKEGKIYLDVCDDIGLSDYCRSDKLQKLAQENKGTAIISTGIWPGASSLLAKSLIDDDDKVGGAENVKDVKFSFFTAGSGGAGKTILTATFLLLGENVLIYNKGNKEYKETATDLQTIDFGDTLGQREVARLNLIECQSCASHLKSELQLKKNNDYSGVNIQTFFGTAPPFWNTLFSLMARIIPQKALQNRNWMEILAIISLPMVRLVDTVVGSANGIRVDVECHDGSKWVALLNHKDLERAVGDAIAAFVVAIIDEKNSDVNAINATNATNATNSNDDNSLPYGGAVPYGVFFPEEFPSKKFGKTILDFVSKEERECTEYKIFKQ